MKQRITIEQLKELTTAQQLKLQESWEPRDGDWIAQLSNNYMMLIEQGSMEVSPKDTIKYSFLPLLSIGQMIEFLTAPDEANAENHANNPGMGGEDSDAVGSEVPDFRISWKPDEELADLLWESVKDALQERRDPHWN